MIISNIHVDYFCHKSSKYCNFQSIVQEVTSTSCCVVPGVVHTSSDSFTFIRLCVLELNRSHNVKSVTTFNGEHSDFICEVNLGRKTSSQCRIEPTTFCLQQVGEKPKRVTGRLGP